MNLRLDIQSGSTTKSEITTSWPLIQNCYDKSPLIFRTQLPEVSCMILSSFKNVIIFNNTSADFVLISADVLLKMITILKELRITQLCSKNERTLSNWGKVLKIRALKTMHLVTGLLSYCATFAWLNIFLYLLHKNTWQYCVCTYFFGHQCVLTPLNRIFNIVFMS